MEVPSDRLDDYALEAPRVIDLAPGQLAVISLNDLMMDRLLQATGGEPITMDEAVRLATAAQSDLTGGTSLVDQIGCSGRHSCRSGASSRLGLRQTRRTEATSALNHLVGIARSRG